MSKRVKSEYLVFLAFLLSIFLMLVQLSNDSIPELVHLKMVTVMALEGFKELIRIQNLE
jgi:hypothetical protein